MFNSLHRYDFMSCVAISCNEYCGKTIVPGKVYCSGHASFVGENNWLKTTNKLIAETTEERLCNIPQLYRLFYFVCDIYSTYNVYNPGFEKKFMDTLSGIMERDMLRETDFLIFVCDVYLKMKGIFSKRKEIPDGIYEECDICYSKTNKKIKFDCCNNSMCTDCWDICEKCPFCRKQLPTLFEKLLNDHESYKSA